MLKLLANRGFNLPAEHHRRKREFTRELEIVVIDRNIAFQIDPIRAKGEIQRITLPRFLNILYLALKFLLEEFREFFQLRAGILLGHRVRNCDVELRHSETLRLIGVRLKECDGHMRSLHMYRRDCRRQRPGTQSPTSAELGSNEPARAPVLHSRYDRLNATAANQHGLFPPRRPVFLPCLGWLR